MRRTDGGQFFISCSCYVILSLPFHCLLKQKTWTMYSIPYIRAPLFSNWPQPVCCFPPDNNDQYITCRVSPLLPATHHQMVTLHWHCRLKYFFSFFLCLGFNWHNRATQLPPPSLSFLLITMHCSQLNARRNYRNTMRTIFCNKKCYKKMLFSCNLKQKIFLCLLHCK